jgi:hypothetical protein
MLTEPWAKQEGEIGVFEAIHTTRALRRLKTRYPDAAIISQILGAAMRDHMGDAPVILVPCRSPLQLPPQASLPGGVRERLADEER